MYHRVPNYFRDVSVRLSNILDVIGYSQEDRDSKVSCATGFEIFLCMSECSTLSNSVQTYMLGSRGEGSTGPGLESDQDILCQKITMTIVTNLTECQPGKDNFLMVMDHGVTHPGYVKLQKVNVLPDNAHVPTFFYKQGERVDAYGRVVLPNNIFHTFVASDQVVTGPSMQSRNDNKEASVDTVPTIKCKQWPKDAHEWFKRRRMHGWPKAHHTKYAEKDGCFAVAVGHPRSCERDLEWRISFSLTERKITRSFEDTVMKVYILLKMIKKTYIEPYLDDAFSSYHCKVCMLWMRERTPPELWCTENLLYCLTICIKQLYDWATVGCCPDYFIVTNNIFDRKIVQEAQFMLIRILGDLLTQDCRFLLGLDCCYLGQLLAYNCSIFDTKTSIISVDIRKDISVELIVGYTCCLTAAVLCNKHMLSHIPQEYNILTSYIINIEIALQRAHHLTRIYLHNILMTLLSRLGFCVISVCKENVHSLSQEEVDYLVALASACLSLGINCDTSSVRLKLCGLGTMLGDYDLTETCLQHISDHKMRIFYMGVYDAGLTLYPIRCNFNVFLTQCLSVRYSIEQVLQNYVSFSVVYLPSETSITPTALRMEMFRSIGAPLVLRDQEKHFWYEWAVVDSFMCLYFFQYMNFFMHRRLRHQQVAMENMINVLRTEPDIPHRDTGLNLLGYCFMQEPQLKFAFICFFKSLKIRPHHNAAKFYLAILFQKIHYTRRTRIVESREATKFNQQLPSR